MTVGIWLGFPPGVSIGREGVGRFISFLLKGMSALSDDSYEIWCHEGNAAELRTLFSECRNCRIVTLSDHPAPLSASNSFRIGLAECLDILLSDKQVTWRRPASEFERAHAPLGMPARALRLALLGLGFAARVARKALPRGWVRAPLSTQDELCETANRCSRADIFLVPLVTLRNAAALHHRKLVVMHDLVTVEYRELFAQDHPQAGIVLQSIQDTLASWERAKRTSFVSSSEHVRRTHVLKYIRAARPDNTFKVYLPANVDPVLIDSSHDQSVLKRHGLAGRYIFYPTQIRPYKNVNLLLRALAELRKSSAPDLRLAITGNLQDSLTASALAKQLGLESAVVPLGSVSARDLMAIYRFAAVSVIPTLFEGGFPWQALEAMSVGTPVVVSRIPAVLERLALIGQDPDSSGLALFAPENLEDLVAKIEYALAHREDLANSQKPVTSELLKYTWSDAATEYRALLTQLSGR